MSIKRIVFFLLTLLGCFSLSAQEAKDVILVVDTSAGMFSYYNEVNTYLTGPFLAENLKIGDTLHIISFASKPRFEIARRLFGRGDIETVSGRIWLLYPLENNTNSADSSLSYAEQYARSIPGGREKKVFVVSNDEGVGRLTEAVAGRLKPNGIDVIFIRASERMGGGTPPGNQAGGSTPPPAPQASVTSPGGAVAAGNTAAGTAIAGNVAAGNNTGTVQGGTGGTAGNTAAGNTVADNAAAAENAARSGAVTETDKTSDSEQTAGSNAADGQTEEQAGGTTGGQNDSGNTEPVRNRDVPDNSGIQPAAVTAAVTTPARANSGAANTSALPLPLLLGLFLLLLLLLIIIIVIRKHGFLSGRGAAFSDDTASRNAELLNNFASRQAETSLQGGGRRSQYKDPGRFPTDPPMLNLFVEEQNTAIGRRNIHTLKKGSTYSVGGGSSDFLIFLVPVPSRIAELYFDGNNCTFTPVKPNYFPDLGSTPVNECIGKTIRLLSDKNYEVFFHFERYEDPLIALNQLLHSIQMPEEMGGKKKADS
jgi:hypothetical protein